MKIAPAIEVLYKHKNKLDINSKLLIYRSLIELRLNYLAIVYAHNKNKTSLKSLQIFQNKALKIVYKLPRMYSTILLHKNVSKIILPNYGLHEYQVLMFVFKCINRIGNHTITFSQIQLHFNTRNRDFIRVPRCRFETTEQRIDYLGDTKFNNLSRDMKSINRISLFKISCKQMLLNNLETLFSFDINFLLTL